jgi:hypothetical protein
MQILVNNDFTHSGQTLTQAQINSFTQDEQTAINILDAAITNNITITINVGFGSYNGITLTNQNVSEGNTNFGYFVSYSTLRSDLLTFGQPGFFNNANLPNTTSINGVSNFWVSSSEAKIFGIATNGQADGFVGIGTNFTAGTVRVAAFLHEIGHAMGRVPENYNNNTWSSALDLWRFTGQNTRLFDPATNPSVQHPESAAYFSLDGGATKVADWGVYSDPSDFLNPQNNLLPAPYSNLTPNDPFNEIIGNIAQLTTVDLDMMEALGFRITPPPKPAPPAGTTAAMIMRHGSDGQYYIYDIGNNAILAPYKLGQVGTDWTVAGLGGFFSNDTNDMLLRNSNTGQFYVYDVKNNNITGSASLGTVGLNFQVMGFGNFGSFGETDMILRNSSNAALQVYDIRNNQIINSNPMGAVGLNWQFSGVGNFSSRGTSDMIMRNSNTGGLEVYDINSNQITGAAFIGTVGLNWQFSGVGNFSGVPGETDLMLRNSNTGGLEVYDIRNNQLAGAAFIGTVGLEWQFAGIGPIHAPGASDLVLRNSNTGAFEVYDIAGNTLVGAASLGAVGLDWSVGGIAVDPPDPPGASGMGGLPADGTNNSSSQPVAALDSASPLAGATVGFSAATDSAPAGQTPAASGGSAGDVAPLVQAMAGLGGSGATDNSSTAPLGADTSQQTLLTAPQHT